LTFGFCFFQVYESARTEKRSPEYRCPGWGGCCVTKEEDVALQKLKKSMGKEAKWDPHMAETMENGVMPAPPSHLSARQFDEVVRREREDTALPGWRFVGRGDGARDESEDIGMASACSSAVQKTLAKRNADRKREICGQAMTARRTDKPAYLSSVEGSSTKTLDDDTERSARSSIYRKVYMPQMRARRTDMSAYFTSTDGLLKELEDEDTERSAPFSTCNKVYYDYAYTLAMG